jgi:D-3-phosphoglycerate dehydrogenase
VIGRVGTILGLYGVNIAGMQVGRHHRGGEALMVLNVDDEIPDAALDELKTIHGVQTAYKVSLPPATPRPSATPAMVGAT